MTEELSPEFYQPPSKERKRKKIPSKKRWREMVREYIEINPQMEPEEVIRRTKQVAEGQNPHKSEEERTREEIAMALRKERLRRDGYGEEWTYYGVALQPKAGWNTPFTEEDMKKARASFPEGLEVLVVQGHIAPTTGTDRTRGEFYDMNHFWETFIRVKPTQIETPTPQIESPKEQ